MNHRRIKSNTKRPTGTKGIFGPLTSHVSPRLNKPRTSGGFGDVRTAARMKPSGTVMSIRNAMGASPKRQKSPRFDLTEETRGVIVSSSKLTMAQKALVLRKGRGTIPQGLRPVIARRKAPKR